jgi:O-Antigen ligase
MRHDGLLTSPRSGLRPKAGVEADQSRAHPGAPTVLRVLGIALVLYLAFGKGFAYAGVAPVFVGELLLVTVVLAALGSDTALPRNAAAAIAALLAGVALVQLAVDRFTGADPWLESVRGVAPIYYSGLAFAVYALLRRYEARAGPTAVMRAIEGASARAAPVVVVLIALLLVVRTAGGPSFGPTWPISGGPLLITKATDIAVALTIVLPALLARPAGLTTPRHGRWLLVMWVAIALVVSFRSRAALGGLAIGYAVARPSLGRAVRGLLAIAVLLVVLYVSGLTVTLGRQRELSFRSGVDSVASLVGIDEGIDNSRLTGTRNWRITWWSEIWDDVTSRRMVLHGYGWGDNLAIRYDVVPPGADRDPRVLRAPHNIFFSLAGRAGLAVAVGFLLVPVLTVARSFTRRGPHDRSFAVDGARAGVAAAVLVAFSDVYLESPQGGIVMWTLIGFLWWVDAAHDDRVARATPAEPELTPHRRASPTTSS